MARLTEALFGLAFWLYGQPYGNRMDNEPFGPATITLRQKLAWWIYHCAIALSKRARGDGE